MAVRQKSVAIRQFIVEHVDHHPRDIVRFTADKWAITREAARLHVKALEDEGVLTSQGKTSARTHRLNVIAKDAFILQTSGLREDEVWSQRIKPLLATVPMNVLDICGIAATEMINNVIDHSGSEEVAVTVICTAAIVDIAIHDRGVGIFRKIKQDCKLSEEREAILELSKGKLTTAPKEHSGYGVFFTSRMMDVFEIQSGRLIFTHMQPDDDWLVENLSNEVDGTFVKLTISTATARTAKEVYFRFCGDPDADEDAGFSRTHVPIRLAQYGTETLVSRSQAKRVLARFEKFSEVLLDFRGVAFVGQGFADEIFRVFRNEHPDTRLVHINANSAVRAMIQLAESGESPRQLRMFQ
jgi:anti-sigma regulatory factor (Ser/Thr protein kinase)